jgi:hypothetical protein
LKLLFFLIPNGYSQNINDITYFDEKKNLIGQSPKIKQNSIIKEDKYFQNMENEAVSLKVEHDKHSISNTIPHHIDKIDKNYSTWTSIFNISLIILFNSVLSTKNLLQTSRLFFR